MGIGQPTEAASTEYRSKLAVAKPTTLKVVRIITKQVPMVPYAAIALALFVLGFMFGLIAAR